MFAEEEWTHSPSSQDGSSQTVKVSPALLKRKAVNKQSLLRTLQSLGSTPDWEILEPKEDCDKERKTLSPVKKTKKKKCRKRKRKSNTADEEKELDEVAPETPVKKTKITQPVKKSGEKNNEDSVMSKVSIKDDKTGVRSQMDEGLSQTEKRLSRKQWRNRMKNKRNCKNKYLKKPTNAENSLKEEPLVQTKSIPKAKDFQKPTSCSKKIETCEKNGISYIKDKATDLEDTKTEDSSKKEIVHLNSKKSKKRISNSKKRDNCEKNGISSIKDKVTNVEDLYTEVSNETETEMVHGNTKESKKLKKCSKITKGCTADRIVDDFVIKTDASHKVINEESSELQKEKSSDISKTKNTASMELRAKLEKRLEAARFRCINEMLYTSTSTEAKRMFQQDPDAIAVYHKGYTTQVQHWPSNPVDSIISYISQKSASLVVADFGCGDCKIAQSVKNKVHSFDLAPVCKLATACDMAKVPLSNSSVDIVVFCLSLMGTNLLDFLVEANRVLVMGGVLKIAEVASRFENVHSFIRTLSNLGFKIVSKDTENGYFYSFEFVKTKETRANVKKFSLQLKPCLYKKR